MMARTRLTKLRMKELSGVDEPANDLPGWIVAKAKNFKGEVEEFEKDVVGLYSRLEGDSADLYFDDAPDEVKHARDVLTEHLSKGIEEVEDEDEDEDEDIKPEAEVKKDGVVSKLREIFTTPKDDEADEVEKSDTSEGDEDEDETDEEVEKGNTDADETPQESEDDEGIDKVQPAPDSEEVADTGGSGETEDRVEKSEDESEEDKIDPEEIAKSVAGVIGSQLEPLREAVLALADRTENLEKNAAGRSGLDGQENGEVAEELSDEESLTKAFRTALREGKVELT